MVLNKYVSLQFISNDNFNFFAELLHENKTDRIPLLLTKKQKDIATERLAEFDYSDYSFHYLKMFVSGCLMYIMRNW